MTNKEKANKVMGMLAEIADGIHGEPVAMSEANDELTQEDKINQMYDYLFAAQEVEVVEEEEVETPVQEEPVAMSEAPAAEAEVADPITESVAAVAEATETPTTEEPAVVENKVEQPEAQTEPTVDYEALLKAEQEKAAKLEQQLKEAQTKKEPELVHNPEAEASTDSGAVFGTPGHKPLFSTPQDSVFAAMKGTI